MNQDQELLKDSIVQMEKDFIKKGETGLRMKYRKLTLKFIKKHLPQHMDKGNLYILIEPRNISTEICDSSRRLIAYLPLNVEPKDCSLTVYEFCEEFKYFRPILSEYKEESNNTGGSVSYYKVDIVRPLSDELPPYIAEFEDIALALGLNPMEYNIMKDLWRNANARTNGNGKEGNTQLRTYQKAAHYSKLLLEIEERK